MSDPDFKTVSNMIAPEVGDTQKRYHYGRCCRLFYTEKEWHSHECKPCKHETRADCQHALVLVQVKHPDVRVIH